MSNDLRERLESLGSVAGDMNPREVADDAIDIFREWLESEATV